MMEDVGVTAPDRRTPQDLRQSLSVRGGELIRRRLLPGFPQQTAEAAHAVLVARHQEELVALVETHQGGAGPPRPLPLTPAVVEEDPGDEALPQQRIVEP